MAGFYPPLGNTRRVLTRNGRASETLTRENWPFHRPTKDNLHQRRAFSG